MIIIEELTEQGKAAQNILLYTKNCVCDKGGIQVNREREYYLIHDAGINVNYLEENLFKSLSHTRGQTKFPDELKS